MKTKKKTKLELNSKELDMVQKALTKKMIAELKKPDTDFNLVAELSLVTGKIDEERRKTWNDEKFGVYEEMADAVGFAPDDIPF